MSSPHEEGGTIEYGEDVRIHPDVVVKESLVDNLTAHHAARTAMKFLDARKSQPFLVRESDDFARVRWQQPGEGSRSSILEDGYRQRTKSFIKCAQTLLNYTGVQTPTYVNIFRMQHGERLPYHKDDDYNGSRTLLLLMGMKQVSFLYPCVRAFSSWYQFAGDSYTMEFRYGPTSVSHEVVSVGNSIAMYVDKFGKDSVK